MKQLRNVNKEKEDFSAIIVVSLNNQLQTTSPSRLSILNYALNILQKRSCVSHTRSHNKCKRIEVKLCELALA